MIHILVGLTLLAEGTVSRYSPDLMEAQYNYRLGIGQVQPCPECIGYVALIDPKHIGLKVYLDWGNNDIDGPYLVVDCAGKNHLKYLASLRRVAEVDYPTAVRRGVWSPLDIRVLLPVTKEIPVQDFRGRIEDLSQIPIN